MGYIHTTQKVRHPSYIVHIGVSPGTGGDPCSRMGWDAYAGTTGLPYLLDRRIPSSFVTHSRTRSTYCMYVRISSCMQCYKYIPSYPIPSHHIYVYARTSSIVVYIQAIPSSVP